MYAVIKRLVCSVVIVTRRKLNVLPQLICENSWSKRGKKK